MIERYLALSHVGKQELLSQTAIRLSVDPIIVEKDIWVCSILQEIFAHSDTRDHFIFKGGTSLSKVYGAIQRFSEDIDLIMDWRLLGLRGPDSDPWDAERSRTKQDRFNKSLGTKTEEYLHDTFVPSAVPLQSPVPSLMIWTAKALGCPNPAGDGGGGGDYNSPPIGTLISVPAGSFQRDATPANISVITEPFRMSATEITRAQFLAVMGVDPSIVVTSGSRSPPSGRRTATGFPPTRSGRGPRWGPEELPLGTLNDYRGTTSGDYRVRDHFP